MTTSLVPPLAGTAGNSRTAPPPVLPAALCRAAELVGPALARAVDRLDPVLREPVEHHLRGGGKRVRGALTLLSAAAAGAAEETGVPGAVAVELVHNYSLLHDDIIDGDRERRHLPTVWAEYGVGPAIVAGDSLATLAVQVLLDDPSPERVRAARLLTDANQAMIAGQSADMVFEARASVSVAECLAMEQGKTGALIACAAALGAVLAGAPARAVAALHSYGRHLGVAFQAVDDLLGIWGRPEATGKPVGSDLLARKKTLPVAAALAAGGEVAHRLETLLSRPSEEVDVSEATTLIEASGAHDVVAAIVDERLDRAVAALAGAALAAPARDELVEVARFVTARDR